MIKMQFHNVTKGIQIMMIYCALILCIQIFELWHSLLGASGTAGQVYIRWSLSVAFLVVFLFWKCKPYKDNNFLISNIWGYTLLFLSFFPALLSLFVGFIVNLGNDKIILHFISPIVFIVWIFIILADTIYISIKMNNPRLRLEIIAAAIICFISLTVDNRIMDAISQGNFTGMYSITSILVIISTLFFIFRTSTYARRNPC